MKKTLLMFSLIFALTATLNAGPKPYVILVSFDAFRWDYLNRGITPNLEKIRENGVSAISLRPSFPSKTFPNHLSIVTGMYPAHHGIIANSFQDPFTKKIYRLSDTNAVRNGRWYLGEPFWETAERQGVISASYFWPGSEISIPYRRPTYNQAYEHARPYETRIDGVIEWLNLPYEKRPHFITLYFSETDDEGHPFGPDSPEVNEAIKRLDYLTGYLFNKLNETQIRDSVDVIFVSDHGMTKIDKERRINIENIIRDEKCRLAESGPFMFIEPEKSKLETVYNILKKNEDHYKVYYKKDIPEYYHFNDHPFITSIVVIADLGWSVITNRKSEWDALGDHGFDNHQIDMHGIFLAAGPHFRKNYRTGTLWNIDIYPLLCKIFDIYPRTNIDGNLDRIEFILKN
ncbi:MAG: alkaline phosphatase family protein [Ignavibacteriae bacterium HGW-Ignavibacteriae-3]|nr:MAG: alkaline phosphatase family protein [Ignavibacteriae bacterium HGW-Ignavibacteriae-3]